MSKSFPYLRVSTPEQVIGSSLDMQEEMAWRFHDLNLSHTGAIRGTAIRDEGQSAYHIPLFERTGGKNFIDNSFITAGDHIIFVYFNRAFRNNRDFANTLPFFKTRGIIVHFVDMPHLDMGTYQGRAMAGMMSIFSEMESAAKSERLKNAFSYIREHKSHIPCSKSNKIPGLKVRVHLGVRSFEKEELEFETYLFFLRNASTGKFSMNRLADMCNEHLHLLRGLPYKKSTFTERLWPQNMRTTRIYIQQKYHQNSQKHFYGDRPEFNLPVPPRFSHLRKQYEDNRKRSGHPCPIYS